VHIPLVGICLEYFAVKQDTNRIEVINGQKRAVFMRTEKGWTPDWFYEGERKMLRFKDHEWLSVGHVHPAFADEAESVRGGGAIFRAAGKYGNVDVPWSIRIQPDKASGGFVMDCTFVPAESLELMEAYSTFETPYEYDGTEDVTTVIGQNPVARWEGSKQVTPPQWKHAVWQYSREASVRITGPCNIPILCQAIQNADGSNARYTTVIGDWNVCKVRDVFVTPTRTVAKDSDEWSENKRANLRGYKFIVGALNWSSAFNKDPNVLYKGKAKHAQRLVLSFDSSLPGGTLDTMLFAAWSRAAACDLPANGRVAAYDNATQRGVTWQTAVKWLRDVYCGDGVTGLYLRGKGITTYAAGSRPKAGGDYSYHWWPQWSGGFHYQALMRGDDELAAKCDELDSIFISYVKERDPKRLGVSISTLPSIWWTAGPGRQSRIAEAAEMMVRNSHESSVAENGKERVMDHGNQACIAEGLLLGGGIYGNADYTKQALVLLDEINRELDGSFWGFGCSRRADRMHGGQIRPMGYGHAALANLMACRTTQQEAYRTAALRFARLLLSVNYVTHNNSGDPDFDWRGWANGTNAGRDQYAEFPPWETSNPLLCVAAMMDDEDLEAGFYDVLWYFARTGLAQFPAARSVKRILDEAMGVHFVKRNSIGSERDFYDILPYLAYENPHDQTLLASYQGTDCLVGEMVFGGGLASAADDRLGVVVPQAAMMGAGAASGRTVHVWNPTAKAIVSTVTTRWPDGSTAEQPVTAAPRQAVKVQFSR